MAAMLMVAASYPLQRGLRGLARRSANGSRRFLEMVRSQGLWLYTTVHGRVDWTFLGLQPKDFPRVIDPLRGFLGNGEGGTCV